MRPRNRNRVMTVNLEPSMTKQAPAQETDINYIVNRYLKTGQMPPAPEPQYGYMPSIDLIDAFQLVQDAEDSFMALPAATRAAFANDPVKLLQAVEDPSQMDLLIAHGLANAPQQDGKEAAGSPAADEPSAPPAGDPTIAST